jgi:hypothetical protein
MSLGGKTDERRRLALQLAVQLPDRVADALGVLEETREIVLKFLIRGPRLVVPPGEAAGPPLVERRPSAAVAILASFLLGLAVDLPPFVGKAVAAIAHIDLALALMPL